MSVQAVLKKKSSLRQMGVLCTLPILAALLLAPAPS